MTDQSTGLGGRLSLLEPQHLSPPEKRLYDQIGATFVPWSDSAGFQCRLDDGRLIGPFNPLLSSPELGASFLDFQGVEQKYTSLNERVRQVVILSVGSVWKSAYELYSHAAAAKQAGLPDEAVAKLMRGEPSDDLSEDEKTAQQFARQLSAERRVEPAVYAAAEKSFERKGLIDMTILAGTYNLICALLNAFEIPAPKAGAGTAHEHS